MFTFSAVSATFIGIPADISLLQFEMERVQTNTVIRVFQFLSIWVWSDKNLENIGSRAGSLRTCDIIR